MIQPSHDQQSALQGDTAEKEAKTAWLVSSCTLPVAIPPMVGPTWLRVAYSLGSDYVLVVVPEDLPRDLLVVTCVISYVPVGCVSCHVSLPSCRCLCTILSDSAVMWGCVCTYCRDSQWVATADRYVGCQQLKYRSGHLTLIHNCVGRCIITHGLHLLIKLVVRCLGNNMQTL